MRIVFMGTPDFAVQVLASLLDAGREVVGVFTRPDRPVGRGKRMSPPPVKRYSDERGLPVFQPASLKSQEVQRRMSELRPDVIVVAAYGRYIPREVLELPLRGCLNVHPSLLPKYRGPSPVSAAILAGDDATGVTVMKVTEEMDAGPIVTSRRTAIGPDETAESLTRRLFELGAELLVEVLPKWAAGDIEGEPQDQGLATATKLLTREDGEIDWNKPAAFIARQVRAYHPWPGAYTRWDGKLLKIVAAHPSDSIDSTGDSAAFVGLPEGGLAVTTAAGALIIDALQLEGGRPVAATEFLSGHPNVIGARVS